MCSWGRGAVWWEVVVALELGMGMGVPGWDYVGEVGWLGWGWWVGGLGEGGEGGVKVVEVDGVGCGLEGGWSWRVGVLCRRCVCW